MTEINSTVLKAVKDDIVGNVEDICIALEHLSGTETEELLKTIDAERKRRELDARMLTNVQKVISVLRSKKARRKKPSVDMVRVRILSVLLLEGPLLTPQIVQRCATADFGNIPENAVHEELAYLAWAEHIELRPAGWIAIGAEPAEPNHSDDQPDLFH